MEILEVSKEEYTKYTVNPFSKFETAEFTELNKHKADEVKYFIFGEDKKRFSLTAGIKDGVLKCPFSAAFGIFSEITKNNKIQYYHEAVSALKKWALRNNIKEIIFAAPALFYNYPHITKFHNALICNGFKEMDYDVNFQYKTGSSPEKYIENLSSNSRRNLKIAFKNELTFEKTDDLKLVYAIIKQNREEKGFPLWMSAEDIENTSKIIESDYFLVYTPDKTAIASAYVQITVKNTANVIYWGNIQKYDSLCPMNFLSYKVFEYYLNFADIEYISIGTSTKNSLPNFGLCDFKESIGCECSPKINWSLKLL